MPTYQPLIRYRADPLDGAFAVTGEFGETAPPWTPARPHLGVDYGCPAGTPVYATTYGVAAALTVHDGSFGIYALVDCRTINDEPTEWYDLHAHLSQVNVQPGDRIAPGDLLGLSGNTGFTSGAHLHWQCCRNDPSFPRDMSLMRDPRSFPVETGAVDPAPDVAGALTAFNADVCAGMGWSPTPWRLDVLRYWADLEDDSRWRLLLQANNPLATTRTTDGIIGRWNDAGVGVYRDRAAGVQATVETLRLSYYPTVRACFVDQRSYTGALPELVTYIGSEGYASDLLRYMDASTASKGGAPEPAQPLTFEDLNAAMQLRMALMRLANEPDLLVVEAAHATLKAGGFLS